MLLLFFVSGTQSIAQTTPLTAQSLNLTGFNPTSSVNGFGNQINLTGYSSAIVFDTNLPTELMFGFHRNGNFYWGKRNSDPANLMNYYPMTLNALTSKLTIGGELEVKNQITSKLNLTVLGTTLTNRLKVTNENSDYSFINIGKDVNDYIIADNTSSKYYGGGYFFRVHDESHPNKYRNVLLLTENGDVRISGKSGVLGNFGIGTYEPAHKLHVKASAYDFKTYDYGSEITVKVPSGGWARSFRIRNEEARTIDNINASNTAFGAYDGTAFISAGFDIVSDPTGYKNIKLAIKPSGNVGVGTFTPESKLTIIPGAVLPTVINNKDIYLGALVKTTSGRSGFTVLNSNNYLNGLDNNAHFSSIFPFEDSNTSNDLKWKAFRLQTGVNLVDKFWVNKLGDGYYAGKLGVNIGSTNVDGDLQVGNSTVNGMVFLGGGKGYAGIGSTRSDGGLVLGYNIYARYDGEADNLIARVGQTYVGKGYSGIKIGQNGVIDFFGKNGNVTANDIANTPDNIKMRIDTNGNVSIGALTSDKHKLAVGGKMIAEEVNVQLRKLDGSWPDYVFEKEYKLPALVDVENHIKEKGHLQNIPSANEVLKEGINLGEMNAKLLEKIEELTLYTIQQEKEIKSQEERLAKLEKLLNQKE